MIELSAKFKNIIFWALTASISLIVFGIFVIDIFVIDAHGKDKLSIIFSYLSTIFAFLSALALFATIGVYFSQKNDAKKQKNKEISAIKSILSKKCERIYGLINTTLTLIHAIKKRNKEIEKHTEVVDNYKYIKIRNNIKEDKYTFHIKNEYFKENDKNYKNDFSYTIKNIQSDELNRLLYTSASLDVSLFNNMYAAISAITEANHILDCLIEFDNIVSIGDADGFIYYMEDELEWQLTILCEIYYECTGEDLESKRPVIR